MICGTKCKGSRSVLACTLWHRPLCSAAAKTRAQSSVARIIYCPIYVTALSSPFRPDTDHDSWPQIDIVIRHSCEVPILPVTSCRFDCEVSKTQGVRFTRECCGHLSAAMNTEYDSTHIISCASQCTPINVLTDPAPSGHDSVDVGRKNYTYSQLANLLSGVGSQEWESRVLDFLKRSSHSPDC